MKGNIIALSGIKRSGKDTICKKIIEKDPTFERVALADKVKKIYAEQNNITLHEVEEKKDIHRNEIIKLGEEKRKIDKRYWINECFKEIDIGNTDKNIIITDIRRIEELKFLSEKKHENNKIRIVEVIRPYYFDDDIETIKALLYGKYYNIFDHTIINDKSLKDLKYVSEAFYENIKNQNKERRSVGKSPIEGPKKM